MSKIGDENLDVALLTIIFQGIPETVAFTMMFLVLTQKTKEWKKGILIGILLGVLIFFIRKLPLIFGMHSLIMLIIFVPTFNFIFKIEIFKVVKITLLGFFIITSGEFLSLTFIDKFLKMDMELLMENTVLWILIGWFHIVLLCAFTLFYYINNKKKRI